MLRINLIQKLSFIFKNSNPLVVPLVVIIQWRAANLWVFKAKK